MKQCENCSLEHEGTYGSGRFCSNKCARGFSTKSKRKEINEKVSKTISQKIRKRYSKECIVCTKIFSGTKSRIENRKFCSKSCAGKYNIKDNTVWRCNVKRSKNEIYFADLCNQHFKLIKCNEPIFNGWDADVIVEDIKVAVLWNGKWHYEKLAEKHSVEQVQNRDRLKIKEIKKCGYIPYVVKDMGSENKDFVEKQFKSFVKWANNQ